MKRRVDRDGRTYIFKDGRWVEQTFHKAILTPVLPEPEEPESE